MGRDAESLSVSELTPPFGDDSGSLREDLDEGVNLDDQHVSQGRDLGRATVSWWLGGGYVAAEVPRWGSG